MFKISGIIREMKWSFKFQESLYQLSHTQRTLNFSYEKRFRQR